MADKWRDLAEAAAWLESESGKGWSARDTLRALVAAAPKGADIEVAFNVCEGQDPLVAQGFDLKNPQEKTSFSLGPNTMATLPARYADDILASGSAHVAGCGLHGFDGRYSVALDPSRVVRFDALRVTEGALRALIACAQAPAVVANEGSALLWTDERKAQARAMQDKLKHEGARDYARQTAKHFGVSPTRLRAILAEGDAPAPWPAFKRP